jgi:hypothetical protein
MFSGADMQLWTAELIPLLELVIVLFGGERVLRLLKDLG